MGILDTTKDVVRLVQQIDNVDLLKRIMELSGQVYELDRENLELKRQVRELQEVADLKERRVQDGSVYRLRDDPENQAFCMKCWHERKEPVPLVDEGEDWWHCPVCKDTPGKPGWRSRRQFV